MRVEEGKVRRPNWKRLGFIGGNCGKGLRIFARCLEVKAGDYLRFLYAFLPVNFKKCSGEWKVKAVVRLNGHKDGKKWKSASICGRVPTFFSQTTKARTDVLSGWKLKLMLEAIVEGNGISHTDHFGDHYKTPTVGGLVGFHSQNKKKARVLSSGRPFGVAALAAALVKAG